LDGVFAPAYRMAATARAHMSHRASRNSAINQQASDIIANT